jgi:large repetitive protein
MGSLLLQMRRRARRATGAVRRPQLETLETRALLAAVTWTGGGGDNNWDTPANWSTDSVPGSGDDVTIDVAANVVHSDDVTDSINSLTSMEPLTISGGTLSIAAASTIDSTLTLTGGTLTGTGDVTVSGLVTLTTGTLSGVGSLNANGGMLINAPGQGLNFDGRTINNPAGQTATWSGGNVGVSGDTVFNNLGTFTASGNGSYNEAGPGENPSFNNMGTWTTSGLAEFTVPFNMVGGSLDVTGDGSVSLTNGTSTGGAFSIASGASLGLGSEFSAYSVDPTTTISGTGALSFGADPITVLTANYSFAGSTEVYSGDLQVDGSLISSGISVSDDGTLSGTGTVGAISVGDAAVSPGDGVAPGILNVQGQADFAGNFDDEQGQEFSAFIVDLNGPTPGTGYSQLNVAGAVDLAECSLEPYLGFTPASAEQFTIIKSTAPIVGTFDELPQGASLTIGNTAFTISYVGGDGNDVVLTQTAARAPSVTGINPDSGPTAGGTAVTINGTGFTGATAVDFGTTAATGVVVVNDTTITATSPAGTGVADVTVVTPSGTSATSAADRFTYTAVVVAPTVTGVSPDSGPTAGGTSVTINGSGFTGATAVDFGTTAATDFVVVNGTTITAVSPAGTGVADVTVITSAGASATTSADRFTYVAPPPTVVSVKRFGFHMLPTSFVLTFDSPLDPARASDPASYQLVDMAHPRRSISFRSATYNATNDSVTLRPVHRLYLYDHYRLTVANPQSMAAGDPVDVGTTGGDFVTTVSLANLVLTPAQRRDGSVMARIRSLAVRFPGLAHLLGAPASRARA